MTNTSTTNGFTNYEYCGPDAQVGKLINEQLKEIERLRAGRNEVYRDAADLALLLHAEYWPENTGWSPLEDTRGVLTQISNMCTLMRDQKAEIERLRAALERISLATHTDSVPWISRSNIGEIARAALDGKDG